MRIKRLHDEHYRQDERIRLDREDRYHNYREWREQLDIKYARINQEDIDRLEMEERQRQKRLTDMAFNYRYNRINELRRHKIRVEREVDESYESLCRQREIDLIEIKLVKKF